MIDKRVQCYPLDLNNIRSILLMTSKSTHTIYIVTFILYTLRLIKG